MHCLPVLRAAASEHRLGVSGRQHGPGAGLHQGQQPGVLGAGAGGLRILRDRVYSGSHLHSGFNQVLATCPLWASLLNEVAEPALRIVATGLGSGT